MRASSANTSANNSANNSANTSANTSVSLPSPGRSLQPESFTIQSELASLNRKGFLTINSQPAVNGVESSDKVFGWGGKGGYCYQKAYVECFVSPENLRRLMEGAGRRNSLNVYACNARGEETRCGAEGGGVTALTWGVFPNREVLQPTIFDPDIFFTTWSEEVRGVCGASRRNETCCQTSPWF